MELAAHPEVDLCEVLSQNSVILSLSKAQFPLLLKRQRAELMLRQAQDDRGLILGISRGSLKGWAAYSPGLARERLPWGSGKWGNSAGVEAELDESDSTLSE